MFLILFLTTISLITQKVNCRNLEKKKNQNSLLQTLSDKYLNQVIHRKKKLISDCAKKNQSPLKSIFIHLTVFPSGRSHSRLISSKQNTQTIQCVLKILDLLVFKKFLEPKIEKNYYFIAE